MSLDYNGAEGQAVPRRQSLGFRLGWRAMAKLCSRRTGTVRLRESSWELNIRHCFLSGPGLTVKGAFSGHLSWIQDPQG